MASKSGTTLKEMFSGTLRVHVRKEAKRPKFLQAALDQQLSAGTGAANALRFQCRIAQDVMESLAEPVEVKPGLTLVQNKAGKGGAAAQFGRNGDGEPFLTVGVKHVETGATYTLTWTGVENIPRRALEIAVDHDEGRGVRRATDIAFQLERAKVSPVGHDRRIDGTKIPSTSKKRNNANRGTGKPRVAVHHDRWCRADMEKVLLD